MSSESKTTNNADAVDYTVHLYEAHKDMRQAWLTLQFQGTPELVKMDKKGSQESQDGDGKKKERVLKRLQIHIDKETWLPGCDLVPSAGTIVIQNTKDKKEIMRMTFATPTVKSSNLAINMPIPGASLNRTAAPDLSEFAGWDKLPKTTQMNCKHLTKSDPDFKLSLLLHRVERPQDHHRNKTSHEYYVYCWTTAALYLP